MSDGKMHSRFFCFIFSWWMPVLLDSGLQFSHIGSKIYVRKQADIHRIAVIKNSSDVEVLCYFDRGRGQFFSSLTAANADLSASASVDS